MKRRSPSAPTPQRSHRSPRGDASYSKSGRSLMPAGSYWRRPGLLHADRVEEPRQVAELEPGDAVAVLDFLPRVRVNGEPARVGSPSGTPLLVSGHTPRGIAWD